MKHTNDNPAAYVCATIDVFNIQVMLVVGDRNECAKLIDRERAKGYKGPSVGDGFLKGLEELDRDTVTRNGYKACCMHVEPGVIIYSPGPIMLKTLVHEVSHVVDYVLHITGADCEDGELRAYLSEYLFDQLAGRTGLIKEQ